MSARVREVLIACFGGPRDRAARRALLVSDLAPELVSDGATRVQLCVADEVSAVRGPSPFHPAGPDPVALITLWIEDADAALARIRGAGFTTHAWRASRDVYTDYGEHPAFDRARDWPDGQRSPTVTSVNCLERPASIDLDTWIARWHGRMSPVSAAIQPRVRYVRNLLLEPLTEGAPAWQAIVEEVWPTPSHVGNPFLFYGAGWNPLLLVWNMIRVVAAVFSFLRPWRVRAVMMSEYFIHTDGPDVPEEKRADGPPARALR